MAIYLLTASLPSSSGIAKDSVTNNFVFFAPDNDDAANATYLTSAVAAFYNVTQASGDSISDFIGHQVPRTTNACKTKLYYISDTLAGGSHGSPVGTGQFTLGAPFNDSAFPEEVAFVLTLNGYSVAPAVSAPDGVDSGTAIDRPLQRHRGRIYIGPLMSNAGVQDAGLLPRPTTQFATTVRQAANTMRDAINADSYDWMVWSRKDAAVYSIQSVRTDDAWDTQRRRGLAPTTAVTLAVS